jgi:hypothetical protein
MKIVDPLHRPGRRLSCGPKSCACGCALAMLAVVLGFPAMLGWLLSGPPVLEGPVNRDDVHALQRKIDTLGSFYDPTTLLRSQILPTIVLTEPEINAYIADMISHRVRSPIREAIRGMRVEIQDGQFVVAASMDLNRLGGTLATELPWPFQVTTRLDVVAVLEWVDGKGRLSVRSVRAGSIEVSGDLALRWLAWVYPPAQPRIELMKGFPLPFGATGIQVHAGQIVIQGSR